MTDRTITLTPTEAEKFTSLAVGESMRIVREGADCTLGDHCYAAHDDNAQHPPVEFVQACAPCETCGGTHRDGHIHQGRVCRKTQCFGADGRNPCPDCRIELVGPCTACESRAAALHNAYEVAAERHGWATQERSRKPWGEVPEANRATMIDALRVTLGCDSPAPCKYGTVTLGYAYAVGRPALVDMVLEVRGVAFADEDDDTEVVVPLNRLAHYDLATLPGQWAIEVRKA